MCEMLSYVSGARHPVVMADANRSTATPWNIYGDQRDAMAMRDSGFVQLYVESGQEALDTMLMAYRLAEDPEVMLPVMVNLDGFTLTHTYDLVDIPDQTDVDRFLPPFQTTNKLDMNTPMTLCATVAPPITPRAASSSAWPLRPPSGKSRKSTPSSARSSAGPIMACTRSIAARTPTWYWWPAAVWLALPVWWWTNCADKAARLG